MDTVHPDTHHHQPAIGDWTDTSPTIFEQSQHLAPAFWWFLHMFFYLGNPKCVATPNFDQKEYSNELGNLDAIRFGDIWYIIYIYNSFPLRVPCAACPSEPTSAAGLIGRSWQQVAHLLNRLISNPSIYRFIGIWCRIVEQCWESLFGSTKKSSQKGQTP